MYSHKKPDFSGVSEIKWNGRNERKYLLPNSKCYYAHYYLKRSKSQKVKSRLRRNEILGLQSSDEIVRFAHDEIKSVLQPDEVGFHHEVISSTKWIYPVRKDGFS